MLIKKLGSTNEDGTPKLKNMHVPDFPEMTLFMTELVLPSSSNDNDGKVIVRYKPPIDPEAAKMGTNCKESRTIEIPLEPDVSGLDTMEIVMHKSPTTAYNMGNKYNDWFTECFGFEVIFAYIGQNRRKVLGSMSPSAQNSLRKTTTTTTNGKASGWLSSITSSIPSIGFFGGAQNKENEDRVLTFSDAASYMVASETSLQNVSDRLPEGEDMDMSKFRPNIVVSGAATAWEEDFWGELSFQARDEQEPVQLILTSNCLRCVSVNIDYATGKPGKGESGQILKKLNNDRRVDAGSKWSPVFGRYGFLKDPSVSAKIHVGDKVEVSKRLPERTTFGMFYSTCYSRNKTN
jgi:uncharacterized protein YcbX